MVQINPNLQIDFNENKKPEATGSQAESCKNNSIFHTLDKDQSGSISAEEMGIKENLDKLAESVPKTASSDAEKNLINKLKDIINALGEEFKSDNFDDITKEVEKRQNDVNNLAKCLKDDNLRNLKSYTTFDLEKAKKVQFGSAAALAITAGETYDKNIELQFNNAKTNAIELADKMKNEIANAVNNVLKENKDATTVDPSKIGVLEQIRNAKGFTIDFGPAKLTPLSSRVEGYSNDYRQANTNNEVEGQSVEEAGSEIVRPFDFIKIEIPYTIKHRATGQEETTTLE
ncbi:hypothetical protein IJ384_07345, partial [bacterium]|nr:hypothetical protein [bacterium]